MSTTTSTGWLAKAGQDIKAVFAWLGSPKGQTIVTDVEVAGEDVATAAGIGAPVQAGINLLNTWGTEIIKTEALAAAAGQQEGSGEQKAAAVASAMEPQLIAFLKAQGVATTGSAAQTTTITNALVTVLNALGSTPQAAS